MYINEQLGQWFFIKVKPIINHIQDDDSINYTVHTILREYKSDALNQGFKTYITRTSYC
jgi:predicted nucleic acid-binding protein